MRGPRPQHLPPLSRSFAGVKAVHRALFQIARKIHPGGVESVQVFGEAPVGESHAVKRLKHSERAGQGDFEGSGPPTPATVVDYSRGFTPDFEGERDLLSLSSV